VELKTRYDDSNIDSILEYSKKLIGKTIEEILNDIEYSINIKNKGSLGTIIEEYWFGIKPNSSPFPDFEKVGVELKIIPLTKQKKEIVVKERTKVCSINYKKIIEETWEESHAKLKLNKVLFIYYLYEKEDIKLSQIKKIDLWELNQGNNEFIIKTDWIGIQKKVFDGFAHELSETQSKVLAASRSGSGGKDKNGKFKDLVEQPNQTYEKEALKRAFSLKQSFTNQRWKEISTKSKYESLIDSLNIKDIDEFDKKILEKLNNYKNKSIEELSEIFRIKIPNGKNKVATIIKKAIGFKNVNSNIKEFEQLGIAVKTIKVRKKDNKPIEAVSFPTMKLKDFEIEESFEDSTFLIYINKILFVPVYYEGDALSSQYLGKSFFWSPSLEEYDLIEKEWNMYKQEVLDGKCKVTKIKQNSPKGYKEVSQLSKESDTQIIHIRPHGKDSSDRDIDSKENSIVKQCFWLNKVFIQKLLNKTQI
jgi:DNA mismatch repair endonuclease MutH